MKRETRKKIDEIVLTLCVTFAFSACANRTMTTMEEGAKTPAMQKEVQAAEDVGAQVVSRIQFDEGRTSLTPEAREELNTAITKARSMGKVEKVTLAVWSDKEYPITQKKLSAKQIELANKRGEQIENYLEQSLNVGEVKFHNMSKQPNAMARIFDTADAQLKEKLMSAGMTPEEGGMVNGRGRASSALILVEVE